MIVLFCAQCIFYRYMLHSYGQLVDWFKINSNIVAEGYMYIALKIANTSSFDRFSYLSGQISIF